MTGKLYIAGGRPPIVVEGEDEGEVQRKLDEEIDKLHRELGVYVGVEVNGIRYPDWFSVPIPK